jgi:hypothetical protein
MRHTLDEVTMLEILAAAESEPRPQADPHCPRCVPAGARMRRGLQVGGEHEVAPDGAGGELGHGAAVSLEVSVQLSGTEIPTGPESPGTLRITGGLRVARC